MPIPATTKKKVRTFRVWDADKQCAVRSETLPEGHSVQNAKRMRNVVSLMPFSLAIGVALIAIGASAIVGAGYGVVQAWNYAQPLLAPYVG